MEDFLAYRWDWKDLLAFLTGGVTPKILWITEHAFLVVEESGDMYGFEKHDYIAASIQAMDGPEQVLILVHPFGADTPITELLVFWRAVETSNSVRLTVRDGLEVYWSPLLWYLLEDSQLLRFLEFDGFLFNDYNCRALATLPRTDLEVRLIECKLEPVANCTHRAFSAPAGTVYIGPQGMCTHPLPQQSGY